MPESNETPAIFASVKTADGLAAVKEALAADPKAALAVDPINGGRTALSVAAAAGNVDIVKALLEGGAVDTVVRGWSAACHAAFKGHADTLATLAAGLGVKATAAPAGVNMTPLLLACLKGHLTCASLIIDAVPETLNDRDAHGRTPLMLAASNGNVELIDYLVKRGAVVDDVSFEGKTALMWAIAAHKPFAVAALARLGADPSIREKPNKEAAVVPGKDRELGESIHDLANAKHSRDPTVKHISQYLHKWVAQRAERPDETAPSFEPLPWITHAEAFVAAEAAKAAEAPPEPAAAPAVAADASDIFDVSDAVDEPTIEEDDDEPVGGATPPAPLIQEIKAPVKAEPKGSLDDLDDLD